MQTNNKKKHINLIVLLTVIGLQIVTELFLSIFFIEDSFSNTVYCEENKSENSSEESKGNISSDETLKETSGETSKATTSEETSPSSKKKVIVLTAIVVSAIIGVGIWAYWVVPPEFSEPTTTALVTGAKSIISSIAKHIPSIGSVKSLFSRPPQQDNPAANISQDIIVRPPVRPHNRPFNQENMPEEPFDLFENLARLLLRLLRHLFNPTHGSFMEQLMVTIKQTILNDIVFRMVNRGRNYIMTKFTELLSEIMQKNTVTNIQKSPLTPLTKEIKEITTKTVDSAWISEVSTNLTNATMLIVGIVMIACAFLLFSIIKRYMSVKYQILLISVIFVLLLLLFFII